MQFYPQNAAPGLLLALLVGCSPTDLDNTLPVVSITTPSPLTQYRTGEIVRIEAEASDPDGEVISVSFYIGSRRLGTDRTPPYSWDWDTSEEPLQRPMVRAVAADDSGAFSGDEVEVLVDWIYREPESVPGGWDVVTPEEVGMDTAPLVDMVNIFRRDPEHLIHGIVVIRHGKLAFEKYFDGLSHPTLGEDSVSFDHTTRHLLSSVTKSFTTALLGVAIQKSLIENADEKVAAHFPENADLMVGGKAEITLEHLATMTSGLAWDESTLPLTDTLNDLTAFNNEAANNRDALRWYLSKPLVETPGSTFAYSGGSMNLLGEVIGRAADMPLNEFAGEALFEPLGITDFWHYVFPSGLVDASGDLGLRPRDAAKFGQLFLNDGVWDGRRILPPGWADRSAQPFRTFSPSLFGDGITGYGYGWWVLNDLYGAGAYRASGWGGQYVLVLPDHDMVVVITGGGYRTQPVMGPHEMMLNYILPAIRN